MSGDDSYFPAAGSQWVLPPLTDADISMLREQAYEIIDAVLSATDPEGVDLRARLREHVAAYPGRPETALQEHLIYTRSLSRLEAGSRQAPAEGPRQQGTLDAGPEKRAAGRSQSSIERVIRDGMLVTAFQPVFDLASRKVVGAEALTRFVSEDGDRAHVWFNSATAAGLGVPLEIAALESAIRPIQEIPRRLYIVLNLSPATCLDPRLPGLLKQTNRSANRIVLELTRNFASSELEPLLAALIPLRQSGMRLTVNDAGPDAASMRHVRSLRPDFIKLDRNLIAGIERDSRLQDLVADMVEFGRLTGAGLIAVGIETEAELATVTRLGMRAAQGYYLGRPTVNTRDWSNWTARPSQTVGPR